MLPQRCKIYLRRLQAIDRFGVDLRVTSGDLTDEYRVGFRHEVKTTEDAKSEVMKLFQEAWGRDNGRVVMDSLICLCSTGTRKTPNLTFSDLVKLLPIVVLNALGHLFAVIAMFEKGGGSFTHVIKVKKRSSTFRPSV